MTLREEFSAANPLEPVLSGAGVKLLGQGNKRKACCPFHEDKNPSFSVNLSKGSWNCLAGCGGGGVVEFIARKRGVEPQIILDEYLKSKGDSSSNGEVKTQSAPIDWKSCVDAFGVSHKQRLCEWRGLSPHFVDQMVERQMIGMCDGNLSFPIFAGGRVIGTHQRLKDGWIIKGGTGNPWVIGDHFEQVLIFESQWDAFVVMDQLKWFDIPAFSANCAVVITRGAAKGKAIREMFPLGGTIFAWMQNDKPDAKGNVAADKWLADVLSVVRRARICRPPTDYKDVNEWVKDGLGQASEILDLMADAVDYRDPNLPAIPTPLDFDKLMKFESRNDPDCLIGNRYLCRGGSAIWVGGSGLGKSVMIFQVAIHFALGEDFVGIHPKRPLSSVILSAEDDEGDLAETFQGVMRGMGIEEGSQKYQQVKSKVFLYQECTAKGLAAIGLAQELVTEHKADLLWLNPLLSYYIGNPSDPEKSAEFTGALTNMQLATKVCTMLVHHTGKPKESKTTEAWSIDDFSYIGLGSSVWTNWARAILVLQSMKTPKGVFVLRLAKRGQRSGVYSEEGEKTRELYLEHSENGLCWLPSRFCPGGDENETGGRPSKASWSKVYDAWDGVDKTHRELKTLLSNVLQTSDKTSGRIILKWAGIHIIKNTNDMWVKKEP